MTAAATTNLIRFYFPAYFKSHILSPGKPKERGGEGVARGERGRGCTHLFIHLACICAIGFICEVVLDFGMIMRFRP
jgi:hypothetical protein